MLQDQVVTTKERIQYATIGLFAEKGYGNVSMREIADKVGIKASSLYKHYESKEALLESIFEFFKLKMSQTSFPIKGLGEFLKSVTPEEYLNQSFVLFKQIMWTPEVMKIAKIINTEQQRNQSVRQFFIEELINKPNQMTKYVFDLMMENSSIGRIDTTIAAEEYNSYIVYLYFEQNFLMEEPSVAEIERKMEQHNKFFAQYVLRKEGK